MSLRTERKGIVHKDVGSAVISDPKLKQLLLFHRAVVFHRPLGFRERNWERERE